MRVIRGKKALVTGAASGIGRALALALAREGADLFLVDFDQLGLVEVVREAKQHGVTISACSCDLSQPRDVVRATKAVCELWGGVDILINNAGVCFYGVTTEMSDHQWDQLLAVNLLAPTQITRQLLPNMLTRPEAHILNVSSLYGFVTTNRCSAYHLTKFGLLGFSQALRAENSRTTVGVTALCPGFVDTNLFTSMPNEHRKARVPPRWVMTTPERVAEKAIRGIYRNRRIVLVTPLAHLMYYVGRVAPGLTDWLYHLGRRRKPATPETVGLADVPARNVHLRKAA